MAGPADAVKERGGTREGEDLKEGSTLVVGQDESADAELRSPCDDVQRPGGDVRVWRHGQ